jgi:hypothetical protein
LFQTSVKIKLAKSANKRDRGLTIEADMPIIFWLVFEYFEEA